MTTVNAAARAWSIGSAIQTAGSVLVSRFVPFVATALVASLPSVLFVLLVGIVPGRILATAGIVSILINLPVIIFVTQALTYGTVEALRGRDTPIGSCLLQGLKRLPTGLGVGLLFYTGFALGLVLLIVPGIILAIMWSVALSAATVERTGVFASLSRSRALTRGRRWRAFGALLIPVLLSIGTGWALSGVFGAYSLTSPTFQIVSWLIHAIEQAFGVCVVATLYFNLRREKEGVDIEQIASVFD